MCTRWAALLHDVWMPVCCFICMSRRAQSAPNFPQNIDECSDGTASILLGRSTLRNQSLHTIRPHQSHTSNPPAMQVLTDSPCTAAIMAGVVQVQVVVLPVQPRRHLEWGSAIS